MHNRDYKDIIGGGLLMAFGAWFCIYALMHYRLGTFTYMEAGMVPVGIGGLLAFVGAFIFVPAFFRHGTIGRPHWRSLIAVMAGLASFALTVDWVGLIPAVFLLTLVSSFADPHFRWSRVLLLALFLSILIVVIFRYGLEMRFRPFLWPF